MNQSRGMARNSNDGNAVRTVVASVFGLLPVGVVSGMMVMQMLGIWTY